MFRRALAQRAKDGNPIRVGLVGAEGLLPFGFAYGARLEEPVKKGEAIRWSQVEVPQDSFLLKLYRLQESTFR
jgi:predicted homoserine dehydrogenase-like protein